MPKIASRIAFIAYGKGKNRYILLNISGRLSIGYEPEEPATYTSRITTTTALPRSPKASASE